MSKISNDAVAEVLRLRLLEGWSIRKIARTLHLSRKTVRNLLASQRPARQSKPRPSKLDPFKPLISQLLETDSSASGAVILQRIRQRGYTGGETILLEWLRKVRPRRSGRAFLRMEVLPGERFEVDWGHLPSLDYQGDRRKLYVFTLIDAHSRKLYVEFTHSQDFETFVRCHQHAFGFLSGVARELAYDNLATAVVEHDGNLVRFNRRFLGFAREYGFCPRACHVHAPWEKGKVERAGVAYVKQNFFPLRSFRDLADVNRQARQWLDEVANKRIHRETRQRPDERFDPSALKPVPDADPDYRQTRLALVHSDLRIHFDSNRYCVPARFAGSRLTLKADSASVTIYDGVKEVVSYARSYRKGQTFGAERFEKELLSSRPAARRSAEQRRLITLLGSEVEQYLTGLASTDRPLARQLSELLELVRLYNPETVSRAIAVAQQAGAFGSSYVANILHQMHSPRAVEPPVRLRDEALNLLQLDPVRLIEYDSIIFDDRSRYAITQGEAGNAEAVRDEGADRESGVRGSQ